MINPKRPWLIRYSYDPLDRLTSHARSDTPERHRFYCKNRLATEIQGAIEHSIFQYSDFLLAQQQREQDVHDTTLLATDLQRSVVNTLKKNTERKAIAYSPYGFRLAESGLTSLLGFNGERPDPVTGHYLLGNGYRAFNSALMRFNSPDSLSPFGKGGINSYAYCKGDPVNFIDPTGHSKNFISRFFNKTNKTKINKKNQNTTLTLKTEVLEIENPNHKQKREQQIKLIYDRHPLELISDDPTSLANTAPNAVPPDLRSELAPGLFKRDIAREIFLEELNNQKLIGLHGVSEKLFMHLGPTGAFPQDLRKLPPMLIKGLETHSALYKIASDRTFIPFDINIANSKQGKIRKS